MWPQARIYFYFNPLTLEHLNYRFKQFLQSILYLFAIRFICFLPWQVKIYTLLKTVTGKETKRKSAQSVERANQLIWLMYWKAKSQPPKQLSESMNFRACADILKWHGFTHKPVTRATCWFFMCEYTLRVHLWGVICPYRTAACERWVEQSALWCAQFIRVIHDPLVSTCLQQPINILMLLA